MQDNTQKTPVWRKVKPLRVALIAGVVALLSVTGIVVAKQLARPDLLPITELRLVGEFKNVAAIDVKNVFELYRSGNFLTLDVNRMHAAVSALPWVRSAWVDRIWPNVVQVRIKEQKAFAVWDNQKLMNDEAQIFADLKGFNANGLPVFTAPEGSEKQMLAHYQKISGKLAQQNLVASRMKLDARGSLSLTLNNGLAILVGRGNIDKRIDRFLNVYAKKFQLEEDKIAIVDMRYTNGLAVEWKNNVMSNVKAKTTVGSL